MAGIAAGRLAAVAAAGWVVVVDAVVWEAVGWAAPAASEVRWVVSVSLAAEWDAEAVEWACPGLEVAGKAKPQ